MRRNTRYTILDDRDEQETVALRPKVSHSLQAPPTGGFDMADLQLQRWRASAAS